MGKGAIILGVAFILFGIFLMIITKFHFVGLIYSLASMVIGVALITLWKEEDKIEERKDLKSRKS